LTDVYLGQYDDYDNLTRSVKDSGKFESLGLPSKLDASYIFSENNGGRNGHLLQASSLHDPNPSRLIDIELLRESLDASKEESYENYKISPNGSLISLTFSEDGSDQLYGRILRISDQTLLADEIKGVGIA
jgi:prolyl oligopeptidase PreP (S9A serine peptidase family)